MCALRRQLACGTGGLVAAEGEADPTLEALEWDRSPDQDVELGLLPSVAGGADAESAAASGCVRASNPV